jgi:hypothetical protein
MNHHPAMKYKMAFALACVVVSAFAFSHAAQGRSRKLTDNLDEVLSQIRDTIPTTDEVFKARPMLGRPSDSTVTVSILAAVPVMVYVEYGEAPDGYDCSTDSLWLPADTATASSAEILLGGLSPDTEYYYRIMCRTEGDADFRETALGCFHTQRARGSEFTFTIQADSHVNELLVGPGIKRAMLYGQTLENVLEDRPDFHIDMGDFAGVEWYTLGKAKTLEKAFERYLLQRVFLGRISASVPFYLVIGNHEGEQGWRRTRDSDSLEVFGTLARKALIPNPAPGRFYTGSTEDTQCCGLRENYYAWEWGDALFVVLDPFWHTMKMPHRSGGYEASLDAWDWTLGTEQYNWLYETLHNSGAAWKFVFSHHMTGGYRYRGGRVDPYGRGGIVAAKYKVAGQPSFEWGGEDSAGNLVFEEKRPGWMHGPVHDMMLAEGVSIFFHGHDHVFVHETLDGITYQACPQPANPRYGDVFYTPELYRGIKVNNSGHVLVAVSEDSVRVDYVRSVLLEDEPIMEDGDPVTNGEISFSYTLRPRGMASETVR